MKIEGRKRDGKFYVLSGETWIEVQEDFYYSYMKMIWNEQKKAQRELRCVIDGKRCMGDCAECELSPVGKPVSLDRMMDESNFDVEDTRRKMSLEDSVIMEMMIEALYQEIAKLPPEDEFLIRALYLFNEPLSQKKVAKLLGVDQTTIMRRRDRILVTLRAALKDWED